MEVRRRELLIGGAAATAAAATGITLATQSNGNGSDAPTLPEADEEFVFPITTTKPQVTTEGGTVVEVNQDNFPIVTGNEAGVFLLTLEPGGLREPHWHPNAWEFDYWISGTGKLGVVTPDATQRVSTVKAGEVTFIPQAWAHYIENTGDEELKVAVFFNNSAPNDIGLSTFFAGMPSQTFTETFDLPSDGLNSAEKPDKTLIIVP